ncbi:MAG: UvrD-helicase domain-containing protein [Coriobacteriia bacterium]|nr:UvrD-helicase domain-containing protein [Coriobacteriia bacterium]
MYLSDEQRAAVDAGPVDLFIGAGAGSGKTRVLTARFVHAVLGLSPYPETPARSILTVTFTERAAGELAERIRGSLVAEGSTERACHVEDAWISTIHGMCSRILRQYAFDAGLDPRFAVANEVEAGMLAHDALEAAIRNSIAVGDEDVGQLLDAMGFSAIMTTVSDLHANIRSMGRSLQEVLLMTREDVRARIDAVVAGLERVRERMASTCRTGLKTVSDNLELLEQAENVGRAIVASGLLGDAGPLCELALAKRIGGDELHNGLVEEANTFIEQLTMLDAQRIVRPYEEALLRLLVAFHDAYAALKAERSLLDFEDLQVLVADLLEKRPDIAREYRQRFRMIMIDEFQDTNELQLKIAGYLSEENLCTVGDDKQSIYSFRHADVKVFRGRESTTKRVERLADNYRSHPELLAFFNGLFGAEAFFGAGLMHLKPGDREPAANGWPETRERARVVFVDVEKGCGLSGAEAEAVTIAEEFAILRDQGVAQGDMVLLLRKMSGAVELFERELKRRGFDVFIASGGIYFDTPEVGELTALLRLADNAFDDEAAVTVLAGRFTRASDESLFRLREAAGRGSLWGAACRATDLVIADADKRVIAQTVHVVERMRSARGSVPLRELLLEACEWLDYDLTLFAGGENGSRAWANVLKLARMAEEFEDSAHGDIGSFLDYLSLRDEHVASEQQATVAGERAKAVRIMSIHAAKGLEFPVVGVASFSGTAPGPRSTLVGRSGESLLLGMKLPLPEGSRRTSADTTAHALLAKDVKTTDAEEIKRLLYVACTRAEHGLVLCIRDDLTKPSTGGSLPALVRQALGFEECGPQVDQHVTLANGAQVDVRVTKPQADARAIGTPDTARVCEEPPPLPEAPEPIAVSSTAPTIISYSGLGLYAKCPYRFYAKKIAGFPLPIRQSGSRGTDPRDFGNAVHEALREACGATVPDEARLASIAHAHGVKDDAIGRLKRSVAAFTSSTLAAEVRSAERVLTECSINALVNGTVLVGSIDLLAWSGETALVVDYKTGSSELPAEEARSRYELQASCYALAVLRTGAGRARVVFFESERGGRQTEFLYESNDAHFVEMRLGGMLDTMAAGEFSPLASYDASVCDDCAAFGALCPVTRRDAD